MGKCILNDRLDNSLSLLDEHERFDQIEPIGPIPSTQYFRWVSDNIGMGPERCSITLKTLSGAQFDYSLEQVLDLFEQLSTRGRERVQGWVVDSFKRGYLLAEDARAVARFMGRRGDAAGAAA